MLKLNLDILYLIFKEFQDDKKALYSYLFVNKTWSEMIIPILWRNPLKALKSKNEELLWNVIVSHLSEKSRNNLKRHNIDLWTNSYQKPLFDYISFCRHLNFN